MTIEIEIQNSKLKSKIKIEKVLPTGIKSQKLKSNWLAPICEHIAGLGVGWGVLGAYGCA